MYRYVGYVWPGMLRVSVNEAKKIVSAGGAVYSLHDDNTVAMIRQADEIRENEEYGIECENFSFKDYFESNANKDGHVVFSHGTEDPSDLLELAAEFLKCVRPALRTTIQEAADGMIRRIKTALESGDEDRMKAAWNCVPCFINGIIPCGWKFGNFANNGLDYVFVKD